MSNPKKIYQVPGSNPDFHKKTWFEAHYLLAYAFVLVIVATIIVGIYYYESTRTSDFFYYVTHQRDK